MTGVKILVVEDEKDICEILKFNLEGEGFTVDVAYSGEEAIKLKLERYSLFLLDIMMGKMSGFRLAEIIRKEKKISSPIVFLTAKDTENDTLTGFSIGADDYISKPFSIREVIARVKAVLKRAKSISIPKEIITLGGMTIDAISKRVIIDKIPVDLTKKEFLLLQMLAEHKGKVFSRDHIMDYVWKDDIIVGERTIDVHFTRLRKKMGKYGSIIVNRSGHGYCIDIDKL